MLVFYVWFCIYVCVRRCLEGIFPNTILITVPLDNSDTKFLCALHQCVKNLYRFSSITCSLLCNIESLEAQENFLGVNNSFSTTM